MLSVLFLMISAHQLLHIKTVGELYLEARLNSMEMINKVEEMGVMESKDTSPSSNFKLVPVKLPNKNGHVYAKVSNEDYENVTKASTNWRLCSSGYPLFVQRNGSRFETTYMHKFIFGGSARHLNGDRLDNRKENLISSGRKQRSAPPKNTDDFVIKRPKVIADEITMFDSVESSLKDYTGYANINYDHKKLFSGEVRRGIPHGYGCLYEQSSQQESRGVWKSGKMLIGSVTKFKDLPACMCQVDPVCPCREVDKVEVVKDGFKL